MHQNSTRQQFVRLCECGCGQPTLLSINTIPKTGAVRGQPLKYLARHHLHGQNHPRYKGQTFSTLGYVYRFIPQHPYANKDGCVMEHRLVMESVIGRYLLPEEVVHHRDGNRQNNTPDNLELFANQSEHVRIAHGPNGRWSTRYDACIDCGTTRKPYASHGRCYTCYKRLTRAAIHAGVVAAEQGGSDDSVSTGVETAA